MILQHYTAKFCEECESLCSQYDQGLACECARPGLTEVVDPQDYPKKWIDVLITIEKEVDE